MKKGFWVVVEEIIRKADIILEVLDARMPELTRIHKIERFAYDNKKPLILVINKADLISEDGIQKISEDYAQTSHVFVSSKNSKGLHGLIRMIRYKANKGDAKAVIVGFPNTGKSSLINRLSKGARVRTSSESGFTRGIQLIRGKKGLMLYDTPGVVPFKKRDEIRLGLISGISPLKLTDPDLVAYELIKILKNKNPEILEKVYGISPSLEPEEFLYEFGRKNNMLKKGGIADERRAAIQILTDWHKGKIRL